MSKEWIENELLPLLWEREELTCKTNTDAGLEIFAIRQFIEKERSKWSSETGATERKDYVGTKKLDLGYRSEPEKPIVAEVDTEKNPFFKGVKSINVDIVYTDKPAMKGGFIHPTCEPKDKPAMIEPLSKAGDINWIPTGNVTGMQVYDMMQPQIKKIDEIIKYLQHKG